MRIRSFAKTNKGFLGLQRPSFAATTQRRRVISFAAVVMASLAAATAGITTVADVARASSLESNKTERMFPEAETRATFRVSGRALIFRPCVQEAGPTQPVPNPDEPFECIQPFTDGTIFLTSVTTSFSQSMAPDPAGGFGFSGIPKGDYVLKAIPPNQFADSIIDAPQPSCSPVILSIPVEGPVEIGCSAPQPFHTVAGYINDGQCDPSVCDSPLPENYGFVVTFESGLFQTQTRTQSNHYEVRVPSGFYQVTVKRLNRTDCVRTSADVHRGSLLNFTCDPPLPEGAK
jgi:hypothetical protein